LNRQLSQLVSNALRPWCRMWLHQIINFVEIQRERWQQTDWNCHHPQRSW